MKSSRATFVVLAAVALGLSGCASHAVGPFNPGDRWPPGAANAPGAVIGVRIYAETYLNGREEGTSLRSLNLWSEETVRAYEESALFRAVKAGSIEADPKTGALVDPEAGLEGVDIRADVRLVERQKANWVMSLLTGVTAFIIPSKVTSDFDVKTTFRDKTGKVLGVVETTNAADTWQQLFLVVVMPWYYPTSVEREVIFDLNRAAIIEAGGKGIFAAKQAAAP